MTHDFHTALQEWIAFHKEHENDSGGVEMRLRYIEENIIPGFFHVMALALRRIEDLEGKPRSQLGGSPLWVPSGIRMTNG